MKNLHFTLIIILFAGIGIYFQAKKQILTIADCHATCTAHEVGDMNNHKMCAIGASPDSTTVFQPDGTPLRIFIKGNQALHYIETVDGYTILKNKQTGIYKYAERKGNGKIKETEVIVNPINTRTAAEIAFLQNVEKNLRPSRSIQAQILSEYQAQHNTALKSAGSDFPTSGYNTTLMILIDYPDQPFTYPFQNFVNLANQNGYSYNGATGSFNEYFLAQSNGNLNIGTHVWGWFRASHNKAYYANRTPELVREAVNIVEAGGFDFHLVDNTNDGEAESIMIVHSGRGQEESGNPDDIWSHSWSMSAHGQDVTYDGVHIDRYVVQPEKYGWSSMTNVGIFCHEFGHALGLPDLYDTDGSSSGVGNFCTMGGGSWLNSGKTPANLSAWCKKELGWDSPVTHTHGTGNLYVNMHDQPHRFAIAHGASEYFLTEYREKTGWDAYLPTEGLAIWHINESAYNNTNELNPIVSLEQADGLFELNNKLNRGNSGDLYPGSSNNTSFNPASTPNTNFNNGNSFSFSISDIEKYDNYVTCRYSFGYCEPSFNPNPWQPVHITNVSFEQINNQTSIWDAPNQIKDYTNQSAYVKPASYLNMSISTHANNGVNHGVKVWIDFNGDLDFLDEGESVFNALHMNSNTIAGYIAIPPDAPLGNVRMRVMASTNINTVTDGCDNSIQNNNGEIEDYTLNIGYCPAAGLNTSYEYIQRVQIGSNYKAVYSASEDGFRDLTNANTNFQVQNGQSTYLDLKPGFPFDAYDENWRVWVDWNQDGDFSDYDELFYDSNMHDDFYPNEGRAAAYRTVPYNAKPGETRMRIAMAFDQTPTLCSDINFGEIWDIKVNVSNPTFYCDATGLTTVDEWIQRVGLKDLINESGNNYGYADFTNGATTDLAKNESYTIKLTPGHTDTEYDENWKVWIDWNQDGDFYDAYETVFETYYGSNTDVTGSIYVPWFAQEGDTRMRVSMYYGSSNPGACDDFTWGEVEDYTVNVVSFITGAPEIGPLADFSANRNIIHPYTTVELTDKSYNNPVEWLWAVTKNGVAYFSSDEQHPTFAFTSEGEYAVTLTVWNDEGDDTRTKSQYIQVVNAATDLKDVKRVNQFDFSVQAEQEIVHLEWIKTHNKSVDHFDIERSFDGIEFEKIDEMIASYDDNATLYILDDLTPQVGENFYRINTIYEDGSSEMSDIRIANIVEVLDFTLYPNPTQDYLNINLKAFIGKAADISIQSNNGQILQQIELTEVTEDNQTLDVSNLKEGQYTLSVQIPNRRMQTRKFVVVKF